MTSLVALATYAMKWFGGAHGWFQQIAENSYTEFGEIVARLLAFPCFKLSNLFFKIAYTLNQRRALVMSRKCAALGLKDFGIQFDDLGIKGAGRLKVLHRLRDIHDALERRNRSAKG
jgi:hypothetical protein